jgi:hypothetical protein
VKYKVFEINPDDIDELNVKDCFSIGEIGCSKDLIRLSKMNHDSLAVGFGESGGNLHGVAGSLRHWGGCSQLWAVFSKETEKYPLALTKICGALIDYAVDRQELKRVSVNVRTDYGQGNKFAKVLGFQLEGVMRRYLPDGADANLYARLF